MEATIFSVNGFWKDDKEKFSDYLICDCDGVPTGYNDGRIFFHGMSEAEIKEAIELKWDTVHDFVITSYAIVETPINTIEKFLNKTGFSRANIPSKRTLNKEVKNLGIISDHLIANIYGYFLY